MSSQLRQRSRSIDSPQPYVAHQRTIHLKTRQKMISSKPTEKTTERIEYLYPPARIRHASVIYKNKLYIWGGTIMDPESKSNPLYLYIYEFDNKRWKRFWTKIGCKQLDAFSGQCHAVINNRWYLFGGLNKEDNYISQLWRLNLDNYQWIKCDQKNQEPTPSQGGCLAAFEKNWLLHYEGFNSKTSNSQHYIYIYSIDSKNWHKCQGNYQLSLKYRVGTSMCIQNGKLFMFGGAYQNGEKMEYLNDLYEVKVHLPSKYILAKVDVKVLKRNCEVGARAEHFMFPIQKNYICLVGGRNEEMAFGDCWLYNLRSNQWLKNEAFNSSLLQRNGLSCVMGQEFFLFGGMQQDPTGLQFLNDLWSIRVAWQGLHTYSQEQNDNTDTSFSHNCCLCYQKRNNFVFTSLPFSSRTITDFTESINFPFSAFGLLMDNCIINSANKISITISTQSNNNDNTVIMIQDNGKNMFSEAEYRQNLFTFGSQNNLILTGCDKKVKKSIQRSNMVKEYGVNLKCGSLRLGKRVLSITYNGQILRVCLIYQQNINAEMDELYYVTHYYAMNESTKQLVDENMKPSKQFIDCEYKALIREAVSSKINKNVLYIFDTIFDEGEELIRCRQDRNDVYLGNEDDIQELQKIGFNVSDSVDISLRAYLSALYLKNQTITIELYLNSTTGGASSQNTLENIDKLCKAGTSVELDGIVEFDFKFAEFYYLREFKPKLKFFSNGILLYYKNRLITRYRPDFGEIIPYLLDHNTGTSNYINLFGFAELPENIPINASKTAFTFTIMLEKMYSRLKFVDQSFKERSNHFLMPGQLPQPRPKPEYQGDELIHRAKKSFNEPSDDPKQQKSSIRKRPLDKLPQTFPMRKKPRRQQVFDLSRNQKGEFTPPNYKMREIQKQMKRAKDVIQEKEREHQVMIQHVDESEYQLSSENNDD